MHDDRAAAGAGHRLDERAEKAVVVLLVDADPRLDGDRQRHGLAHRAQAFRDQPRLGHQAGAEAGALHAIARAADVEVDLVIALGRAERGGARELPGHAAAELQGDRMLRRIEAQQPRARAMQDRPGRDHLGIQQRAPRDQPQEIAAVPIRPVHHRCDREFVGPGFCHFLISPQRVAETAFHVPSR